MSRKSLIVETHAQLILEMAAYKRKDKISRDEMLDLLAKHDDELARDKIKHETTDDPDDKRRAWNSMLLRRDTLLPRLEAELLRHGVYFRLIAPKKGYQVMGAVESRWWKLGHALKKWLISIQNMTDDQRRKLDLVDFDNPFEKGFLNMSLTQLSNLVKGLIDPVLDSIEDETAKKQLENSEAEEDEGNGSG